jgi:hypothetical protein
VRAARRAVARERPRRRVDGDPVIWSG